MIMYNFLKYHIGDLCKNVRGMRLDKIRRRYGSDNQHKTISPEDFPLIPSGFYHKSAQSLSSSIDNKFDTL